MTQVLTKWLFLHDVLNYCTVHVVHVYQEHTYMYIVIDFLIFHIHVTDVTTSCSHVLF